MESDFYFSKYFLNPLWLDRLKCTLTCCPVFGEYYSSY
jgi:hypothetical protein